MHIGRASWCGFFQNIGDLALYETRRVEVISRENPYLPAPARNIHPKRSDVVSFKKCALIFDLNSNIVVELVCPREGEPNQLPRLSNSPVFRVNFSAPLSGKDCSILHHKPAVLLRCHNPLSSMFSGVSVKRDRLHSQLYVSTGSMRQIDNYDH